MSVVSVRTPYECSASVITNHVSMTSPPALSDGIGGACVHTNIVENVEDARLWSLAPPPGLQLHQQFGFIYDVHDLSQSLVPESLHDGGKLHLTQMRGQYLGQWSRKPSTDGKQ